jgi:hypothetical protein
MFDIHNVYTVGSTPGFTRSLVITLINLGLREIIEIKPGTF